MHIHKSILYVEDEEDIKHTYERALYKAGYKVLTASDAQSAIDILDTFKSVNLVIIDIFLPEHNGFAILQNLQSYADWQEIPVILLTAQHRAQIKASDEYLNDLGVVRYLEKTQTSPAELVEVVKEVVGGNTT